MRPLTLRAAAEENAMLIPAVARLKKRYAQIRQPTTIIAGLGDQIANVDKHSVRLHEAIAHSSLSIFPNEGHMLLYDTLDSAKQAVDSLNSASTSLSKAA